MANRKRSIDEVEQNVRPKRGRRGRPRVHPREPEFQEIEEFHPIVETEPEILPEVEPEPETAVLLTDDEG